VDVLKPRFGLEISLEATREAMLEAFLALRELRRNPRHFEGRDHKGWLVRVAKHAAVDIWRKQNRRRLVGGDAVESVPDSRSERIDAERVYRIEFVRRVIDSLPPVEKLVVVLKVYRRFNRDEIACLLKSTPFRSEGTSFRVRTILQSVMAKIEDLGRRGLDG